LRTTAGANATGAENVFMGKRHPGPHRGLTGCAHLISGLRLSQRLLAGDGNKAVVLAVFSLQTVQELPSQLHTRNPATLQLSGKLCYRLVMHDKSRNL